jgi:hypothetical protein
MGSWNSSSGSIELLEKERGCEVEVPKGEKMDWAIVREKSPSTECEIVM